MAVIKDAIDWVGKHPVTTGAIVVGAGLIWILLSQQGASQGGNSTDAAAFYQASAAQGVAGDQLQIAEINAQAGTAQALINANANENINSTWATADTTQTQITGTTQIALAPFAVQSNIGADIASAANAPVLTNTYSDSSSKQVGFGFGGLGGLFGISGGGSRSTSYTSQHANPAATEGEQLLAGLLNGTPPANTGFNAAS